jgi:hypothetical protein
MYGHMLDNIYGLGFTERTPPPLGHSPSPPPPLILCLPQHQIHRQPFFPSPHASAGRGPVPPPAYSNRRRPSIAAVDPSLRGAGPSSRTTVGAGAPPPNAGPPLVVHPPPALLSPPPDLLVPLSSHGYRDKELYHFLESCAPSEAAYLHHCPAPSSRHVSMAVIIAN